MTNTGETFNRWAARLIGAAAAALLLLLIWIAPPPQRAQAQGFGPATSWNQAVTWGGIQETAVAAASDPVRNIGQASHIFTVCGDLYTTGGTYQVEGSYNDQQWYAISGVLAIPAYPNGCSSVAAGGYFPDVRLNVLTMTGNPPTGQKAYVNAWYSASAFLQPPSLGTSSGDPCQDPSVAKSNVEINVDTGGATQLLAAPSDGADIYVCGAAFTLTGTSPTAFLLAGTGTGCATGTASLTGILAPTSGSFINLAMGGATLLQGGSGQALCIELGGTSPAAGGLVTYVEQ